MRTTFLKQIKWRREQLGIKTSAMTLLAGINRQQYDKIEKSGNPNLVTLDKIAEGLNAELMLIPKSRVEEIRRLLGTSTSAPFDYKPRKISLDDFDKEIEDPWLLIESNKGE